MRDLVFICAAIRISRTLQNNIRWSILENLIPARMIPGTVVYQYLVAGTSIGTVPISSKFGNFHIPPTFPAPIPSCNITFLLA